MGAALGVVFGLGLLSYLVLSRTINPDNYFLLKTERIYYDELYIIVFKSGIEFVPKIKEGRYTLGLGRSRYINIPHNALYPYNYSFAVDESDKFIVCDKVLGKKFVVGMVIEKQNIHDRNMVSYTVKIPETYKAFHQEAEGVFPYYKLNLTLLSPRGGGFGYSWEKNTVLVSLSGDSLIFYRNHGAIQKKEKHGIYFK